MRGRAKRAAYRMTEILDYRTLVVAVAFGALLLVGYLIIASLQQAHDATQAQNRSRSAASRRIDLLTTKIDRLQRDLAAGLEQRGDLAAKLAAVAEQVRQMGGRPVVTVAPQPQPAPAATARTSPRPSSRPSASSRPSPSPTRSPKPKPSPSPTCRALPIVKCLPLNTR